MAGGIDKNFQRKKERKKRRLPDEAVMPFLVCLGHNK